MPSQQNLPADSAPAPQLRPSRSAAVAIALGALCLTFLLAMITSKANAYNISLFVMVSAVLGATLVVLSVIDVEHLRLPNAMTLPLIAAGLLHTYIAEATALASHAAAAAAGYISLGIIDWLYRHLRGMSGIGLGDAKLFAASGAWLGLVALPSVLMLAATLGLALAAALYFSGANLSARTRLPFGPCLAMGFWIVWLWGPLESWL